MPRAITLQPLTPSARANSILPSAPENPPSDADVVKSVVFKHDMLRLLEREKATNNDVLACMKYENAVIAARAEAAPRAAPQSDPLTAPPWFDAAMNKALAPIKGDIQALRNDMGTVKDDINVLKGDINVLKRDMNTVKGEMRTVKGDINDLKRDMNTVKGDITVLKGDMNAVKGDINVLKNDMNTVKGDINVLKGDMDTVKKGINDLKGDMTTLNDKMTTLSTQQKSTLRIAAMTFNGMQIVGEDCYLEAVPNEDGTELPTTLPPLSSRRAIRELTPQQQRDWLQYYHPRQRFPASRQAAQNIKDLLTIVGTMHRQ